MSSTPIDTSANSTSLTPAPADTHGDAMASDIVGTVTRSNNKTTITTKPDYYEHVIPILVSAQAKYPNAKELRVKTRHGATWAAELEVKGGDSGPEWEMQEEKGLGDSLEQALKDLLKDMVKWRAPPEWLVSEDV